VFDLLQHDSHHGQQDNGNVQLVPPGTNTTNTIDSSDRGKERGSVITTISTGGKYP